MRFEDDADPARRGDRRSTNAAKAFYEDEPVINEALHYAIGLKRAWPEVCHLTDVITPPALFRPQSKGIGVPASWTPILAQWAFHSFSQAK